jgi:hypothetical protein
VTGQDRWRTNWQVVAPAGAVRVDLSRSARLRRAQRRRVQAMPVGTWVVLCDSIPGSRWRCRSFAARAGVRLDREYAALPSMRAPAYLVQDARESSSYFCSAVLTVPPGAAVLAGLLELLLRLVGALALQGLIGVLSPGRVAVGRRT